MSDTRGMTPGQQALSCYRLGHRLRRKPGILLEAVYQLWSWHIRRSWGICLDRDATIGEWCVITHFGGIFVNGGVWIGKNCHISQDVTIGEHNGCPTIGDNVYLGPGCKLYGKIYVGDNVKIGPNAVIYENIESNSVIVAAPYVRLSMRGNIRRVS